MVYSQWVLLGFNGGVRAMITTVIKWSTTTIKTTIRTYPAPVWVQEELPFEVAP